MSDHPKSNIAILKRKTGDSGSYFIGNLGLAMLTLTKLPKPDEQGNECWMLKVSNPPKKDGGAMRQKDEGKEIPF